MKSLFLSWKPSHISEYQNGLESGKAVDVTPKNVLYFNFWFSCLYTFYLLPSLLKWVMTLIATTYRNMESRQSCRTTYMMRIKESERRPFFKFLDGILFCTIHTRRMKLWQKSRNGNKKFHVSVPKALAEFY